MLARKGELLGRRGASDDARAENFSKLDRGEAGAAGRPEHGEAFAGFELRAVFERVERRAVRHGQAGRALEIEPFRDLDEALGLRGQPLARRAGADMAEHAVPAREPVDARPDALDHTGKFRRRRERERRLVLVLAGDDQRVEEIQRRRLDGDDRLARAGNGIGQLAELEIVGTAEAGTQDGFHGMAFMARAAERSMRATRLSQDRGSRSRAPRPRGRAESG